MKDRIADLVTGILSEARMQETEQHLSECAACRDYARALQSEDALLTEFVEKTNTDMTHGQERLVQTIDRSCQTKRFETFSIPRINTKSSIAKRAAAAMIGFLIILAVTILQQTAPPVWAIEQTIKAIEGFDAIYSSGITVDENGVEHEFEFWARPRKDGTASGDLRMETRGGKVIVVNEQQNVTYKYDPGRNVASVESGITFYSSPWINGEYFRKMKEDCTEWHEEYRKDESTGRDCVFVEARDQDPGNNWSYIFQFDVKTKLPIRGEVWNNSDFKGKPYVTANEVMYNPVLPEGIFDFTIPEGAKVVSTQSSKEPMRRERAMDRIVHIEEGIIRDIPQVPRFCDSMTIEKGKIDVGGCNLYYEQQGEGVPLVLINGGPGGTHHCFHPHFCAAKDFARMIYYDQRGCGLSDYKQEKGYTVNQAVNDLDHLRQKLRIDQWVLLGFSYGGLLAQCYATKYPENVKGLVLVGSSMGFPDESPSRDQEFISQQERKKINQIERIPGLSLAQIAYNRHLNGDWKRQHYYRPNREDIVRRVLYEWVHDNNFRDSMCPSANRVDLKGAFENCPIPTLILEGKWDMGQSADKPQLFHKNHPNSRLVIFEQSGHSIFEDEPQAFFTELRRFLGNLPRITEKALVRWKEHLVLHEKEKEVVEIREGPMTGKERAAIEEFHRIKKQIEKGRKYLDGSTPLDSLLSLISAYKNRDAEAIRQVRSSGDSRKSPDFKSDLQHFGSLQIFRAPLPPETIREGDLWIVYTKEPDTSRLADGHFFVLWKGNWMYCGNMGHPAAALKWHNHVNELKQFFRMPWEDEK